MSKKTFGRPKRRHLHLTDIEQFLPSIGFQPISIVQEWRHVVAIGTYQQHPAVLKLASTRRTGRMTKHEYLWNDAVQSLPEEYRRYITVPRNYASGFYGTLFYFIAERFLGAPLAQRDSTNVHLVAPRIVTIAKATYELEHFPIPTTSPFVQDRLRIRKKHISAGQRLLESSTEWASQIPRNVDGLLSVVEKTVPTVRTSVGHGDFVVRHMFDVEGKIGIIDGEHAGYAGPLYYDVAQLYLRLRIDNQAHQLAHEYLHAFMQLLSPADQDTFWEELKPVLIQRYLGELWGRAHQPQRLDDVWYLHQEILTNTII